MRSSSEALPPKGSSGVTHPHVVFPADRRVFRYPQIAGSWGFGGKSPCSIPSSAASTTVQASLRMRSASSASPRMTGTIVRLPENAMLLRVADRPGLRIPLGQPFPRTQGVDWNLERSPGQRRGILTSVRSPGRRRPAARSIRSATPFKRTRRPSGRPSRKVPRSQPVSEPAVGHVPGFLDVPVDDEVHDSDRNCRPNNRARSMAASALGSRSRHCGGNASNTARASAARSTVMLRQPSPVPLAEKAMQDFVDESSTLPGRQRRFVGGIFLQA